MSERPPVPPPAPGGIAAAIEAALKLRLADRRWWIILGAGLFVAMLLTLVQIRTNGFNTMVLLARLMLCVEAALLLTAWLCAADAAQGGRALGRSLPRLALGFAGGITVLITLAVELLPLLYLHQYPGMAEQGVRVPLLLLQRGLLLALGALAAYHVMLGLSLQLRLPTWASAPLTLGLYGWATLGLIRLSQQSADFGRLNDLYYWNQLPAHLPDFPVLQTERWTHNMEPQWLGYYLLLFAGAAAATLVLWIPAAALRDARETNLAPAAEAAPATTASEPRSGPA